MSLLYSKLINDEEKFDLNNQENQQIDENDQIKALGQKKGGNLECSCEVNKQQISMLSTDVGFNKNMLRYTSDTLKEHNTEIISLKS